MDLHPDARMLNTINVFMNWGDIINNDVLCEDAAVEAAKLLDSTSFLATLDDDSLDATLQAPNENENSDRPEERAAGGAEPCTKRARLDECILFDLDCGSQPSNGTQDEPEKEYFELQPATSSLASSLAPPDVHDIFYDLDCVPSTSSSAQPSHQPDDAAAAAPAAVAEEEEQWVDYYYELDDPHEDLIEKVKAQMAKSDEQIERTDAEFTAALIEKATMDQMLSSMNKSKRKREIIEKSVVFVCFVCSRGFMSTDEMREHVQKAHLKPGADRDFKCRYCRRSYARRKNLAAHELKHEQHVEFRCDKEGCGKTYSTKDSLERHYSDAHSVRMDGSTIEEKTYECATCGDKFGIQKELQTHSQYCGRKSEIKEKRAAKRDAERARMPSVSPASVHAKMVKDKSCPLCPEHGQFASMQARNRHVQRKHLERYDEITAAVHTFVPTPELLASRPFSCKECHSAFSNRAALSTHERRMHGANPAKMFACDKCNKEYPLMAELRKHVKRNEGRAMCRGKGGGDVIPRTPSSAGGSGFSSRASSLTPSLLSPAVWRAASNMAIYEGEATNPERKRAGRKRRAPVKDEESEEEEEMEVDEETVSSAATAAAAADEPETGGHSLDEEIEADKEKEKQQFDSLDDFTF